MADWELGVPCREDGIAFCARCKPHSFGQTVYVSDGGSAFHKSPSCKLLMDGQQAVERRGGIASEVRDVATQVALGDGRFPCQHCYPVAWVVAPATGSEPKPPSRPSPSKRRVRPAWIMERWMDRWGQLTDDEQARFIAHPAIDDIAGHSRLDIKEAIAHCRKLHDVSERLRGSKP